MSNLVHANMGATMLVLEMAFAALGRWRDRQADGQMGRLMGQQDRQMKRCMGQNDGQRDWQMSRGRGGWGGDLIWDQGEL